MGKPRGGNYHWIDNHLVKATRYNGKFTDLVDKEVTIEVFDDGQHELSMRKIEIHTFSELVSQGNNTRNSCFGLVVPAVLMKEQKR